MRFRKKPVIIEAIKYTGDANTTLAPTQEFITASLDGTIRERDGKMVIKTLEGTMIANKGDYIIMGVNGEFYPCKPDIFEKTYERVD